MALLEIKDLEVNYGVIKAIKGVSFDVNEGEIIALIGANGAGKTTILHTITGLIQAKKGSIVFDGKELTKTPPHKISFHGYGTRSGGQTYFPAAFGTREPKARGVYPQGQIRNCLNS